MTQGITGSRKLSEGSSERPGILSDSGVDSRQLFSGRGGGGKLDHTHLVSRKGYS